MGLGAEIIDATSEILRITGVESTDELNFLLQDAIKNKIFFENSKILPFLREKDTTSQRNDTETLSRRSFVEKNRDSVKSLETLRRASLHPLISRISVINIGAIQSLNKSYNCEAPDYVLVMDGKSLLCSLMTEESLKNFIIVLFAAKSVCFFNMLPNHKIVLASMLKECMNFSPVFMSVGGDSELGINNKANVGIGFGADIFVSKFYDIKPLLLFYGLNFYSNACKVLLLSLYFNISLVVVLMVYNYYAGYSAT